MTRPQVTAMLWCLAGVAFIAAGLMSESRGTVMIAVGVAYFVIAGLILRRKGRGSPPGGSGRA